MPKSKRSKIFHLSKTEKKGKEAKVVFFDQIREAADLYSHIYLLKVENMRNNTLKQIKADWSTSRFFFGKNKVIAKALGTNVEEEYKQNVHHLANALHGNQMGLLFSNEEPSVFMKYFNEKVECDYARSGCIATDTFTLPQGPLFRGEEKMPHNMEVQLRSLGLPTCLVNGVVTLLKEHTVCSKGDTLSPEQAHLLKHFYIQMAEFKVSILGYWSNEEWTSLIESE